MIAPLIGLVVVVIAVIVYLVAQTSKKTRDKGNAKSAHRPPENH